ncbi:MAG: hypothetical protein JNN07_25530 [Verrucomicrobiales bacterium]|nr:hypothetical protein [Verrucomicrobiales bacterium]
MSLIDALLLDPPRINIWFAMRTDGIAGSGTQADPLNCTPSGKFDEYMRGMAENTCIHLGPGVFVTLGYYTGIPSNTSWQAKKGMRIVGSGIDVTTIQLVNNTGSKQIYAVGHALSASTVDNFEICDLTIDCNLPGVGTSSAAGAVRIMGSHSRASRIKVKNWGNKGGTGATHSFAIAMLTGDGTITPTITNSGIQDCIAITPGTGHTGYISVLHVGYPESASGTSGKGVGPYIRNCYVSCGQTTLGNTTNDKLFRGLSMAWCTGGIVEGNRVQDTFYGGPYNILGALDVTVRNNVYRNVAVGPLYNIHTALSDKMDLLVEGNQIYLTRSDVNPLSDGNVWTYGILIYNDAGGAGVIPFRNIVVRRNYIGYVPEGTFGSQPGSGCFIYAASNATVAENSLDLSALVPTPMMNRYCTTARYFENRTPAGLLKQGVRATGAATYDLVYTELATDAEDALILSLLRR